MLQNHAVTLEQCQWSDLIESGRQTRFGSLYRDCPSAIARNNNFQRFRSIVRRIACVNIPHCIDSRPLTAHDILIATYPPCVALSTLHHMAGQLFAMALNGNVKAMNRLETIIDGPISNNQ